MLSVVANEPGVSDQAVAAVEQEIAATQERLAELRERLIWEQGAAERAAEAERQRAEEARQERIKSLVKPRIDAAAKVEAAVVALDEALALYMAAMGPIRAELRPDERGHVEALQRGNTRIAARIQVVLRRFDLEPVSFRKDETPLQDREQAALNWWSVPDEGEPVAA